MKNLWFIAIFGIFLNGALSILPAFSEELKIVAIVNDEVITQAEWDRAMAPVYLQLQASHDPEEIVAKAKEIRERILQQLIEERLMLQEARNPKPIEVSKGKIGTLPPVAVSETEVDELVKEAEDKFETPEEFEQAMKEQGGITLEELRARYRDQITIRKLVDRHITSRVVLSPAEVTAYYEKHREEYLKGPAVQTATILVRPKESLDASQAEAQAQELRRQLLQGADFSDLAQRYSDGPNAKMGGRMGFLEKGESLKEIDDVLFALKVGEVSPIVKTPTGFYLFRVEAIRPPRQATLEEVQSLIRDRLHQEKVARRYKEWIAKLKADAYVSIQ